MLSEKQALIVIGRQSEITPDYLERFLIVPGYLLGRQITVSKYTSYLITLL